MRADHRRGRHRSRSGPHFTCRVTWCNQEPSSVPNTNLLTRRVKRGRRSVNDSDHLEVSSHTTRADHRSGRHRSRSGPHFMFRVTWCTQEPSSVPNTNLLTRRVKRGRSVNDSDLLEVSSHTIRANHRSGRHRSRSGPHFTFRVTWCTQEPSSVPNTNLLTRRVKRGRSVNDSDLLEVSSHMMRADHRSGRHRSRSGPHFTFRVTGYTQEQAASHTMRADHRSGRHRLRSGPHFMFGLHGHSRAKQHRTRPERITEAVLVDYAPALTSCFALHGKPTTVSALTSVS